MVTLSNTKWKGQQKLTLIYCTHFATYDDRATPDKPHQT